MNNKQQILDLLLQLGKTKEDVAARLLNLGIKGKPKQCRYCPITRYLTKNGVDPVIGVSLAVMTEWLHDGGVAVADGFINFWFPLAEHPDLRGVLDFIDAFDFGAFPDLITSNHQVGCQ